MLDTNALRQELAKALFDQMVATSSLAQDLGYEWYSTPQDAKDAWLDMADALMPTVVQALTDAWDEGGRAAFNGRFFVGTTIETQNPFASSGDTTNGDK